MKIVTLRVLISLNTRLARILITRDSTLGFHKNTRLLAFPNARAKRKASVLKSNIEFVDLCMVCECRTTVPGVVAQTPECYVGPTRCDLMRFPKMEL